MDEPQVRAIFERLSDAEVPPSRVDVGLAQRSGRRRLRTRRAVLSGPPALAVAALALLAGGVLPGWPGGPHRGGRPADGSLAAASRSFDPLVASAEFGPLPPGSSLISGKLGRSSQVFTAGADVRHPAWSLIAMAEGSCNLSSGQILGKLGRGSHPVLICATGQVAPRNHFAIKGQAPPVNGHAAFRVNHGLAWEYARDSWAVVRDLTESTHMRPGLIAKVAAGARFGNLPGPALLFPFQLTGLPATWRLTAADFVAGAGFRRGSELDLAVSGTRGAPQPSVSARLAGPDSPCLPYPGGESRRGTINGIPVVITRTGGSGTIGGSNPARFEVCAEHTHGLFLDVVTHGGEQPRAAAIFRHDLRILGTNPGSWTDKPLG